MDRLLRRYLRRDAEALPAEDGLSESGQGAGEGAHMDADELNAYAEGALPAAARARYFAHLADCGTCRKLITELTLASGIINEEKQAALIKPPTSKSWREWLAALFSPPVLRYAVPAVALFGVVVVAVIMLRARREAGYVSQNNQITSGPTLRTQENTGPAADTSSANSASESHTVSGAANSNTAPTQGPQTQIPSAAATPVQEKTTATTAEDAPPPPTASRPAIVQTETNDKKEGTFGEEGKSNGQVAGMPAPQPTPVLAAPPAKGGDIKPVEREEQPKTKNQPKEADETVTVTGRDGNAATASKTSVNEAQRDRAARRAAEPSTPAGGARGIATQKSEDTDVLAKDDRFSETRSVGGRRFRRQGNAWVDTAYSSARLTIHVARGSEQYRALIADEPGLRTITQQLGGEVIVVWKSRAYRFY